MGPGVEGGLLHGILRRMRTERKASARRSSGARYLEYLGSEMAAVAVLTRSIFGRGEWELLLQLSW